MTRIRTSLAQRTTRLRAAGITAIQAGVQFGESFGLYDLTDGQRAAVTGLWVALVGVVLAWAEPDT